MNISSSLIMHERSTGGNNLRKRSSAIPGTHREPVRWCVSKGAIQRIHFEAAKKMPLAHRLTHLWADDEVCCISRCLGWRKLLCSPPVLVRDKTCSPSGRCRPRTLATGTEQLFTLLSAANPASERAMRVFLFALSRSLVCLFASDTRAPVYEREASC